MQLFYDLVKLYENNDYDKLKIILKEHFQKEVHEEINRLVILYDHEVNFSKSIWETYGSELSGDFNARETKLKNKIELLKNILK